MGLKFKLPRVPLLSKSQHKNIRSRHSLISTITRSTVVSMSTLHGLRRSFECDEAISNFLLRYTRVKISLSSVEMKCDHIDLTSGAHRREHHKQTACSKTFYVVVYYGWRTRGILFVPIEFINLGASLAGKDSCSRIAEKDVAGTVRSDDYYWQFLICRNYWSYGLVLQTPLRSLP